MAGETAAKVFISSVMDDEMQMWRDAATSEFDRLPYLFTWTFERTPPSSESLDVSYLRHVRESVFVVWLVGSQTTPAVRSEVREALAYQRRLLVFRIACASRDAQTTALLAEVDSKWSRVLETVEELQEAIRQTVRDEIARALRDVPGLAPLAELDRVGRESRARCSARWVMLGIQPSQAEKWARDPSIPPLPQPLPSRSAGVLGLVGGMGAGKSLRAERWLQDRVMDCAEDTSVPLPVYLAADGVSASLSQAVRNATKNLGNVDLRGVNLVLDDLSRCSDQRASVLLEQAWQLASLLPTTTIVVTSRPIPGLMTADASWATAAELTSEQDALALVARACGGDIPHLHHQRWAPSLRAAIRWPLFALLTGLFLRENGAVTRATYSDLLSFLIERSLRTAPASRAAASRLLKKLAVLTVETERAWIPVSEIGRPADMGDLVASGLVEVRARSVSLPLDILREWLAAQSIGDGEPSAERLLSDPTRIHRWRYPLMAFIGSSDFDTATELLTSLVETRPGVAARIISEETPEYAAGRETPPLSDPKEIGERMRLTMGCWTSSLWPASARLVPIDDEGNLRSLGIRILKGAVVTGWIRQGDGASVRVSRDDRSQDDWISFHSGHPPAVSTWPWSWALSELRDPLQRLLRAKNVPFAEGPLLYEFAYLVARTVLRKGIKNGDPIPVVDLVDWLSELRDGPGNVVAYHKSALVFDPAQLEKAVRCLQDEGQTELNSPYPTPHATSRDTWDWYGGDEGVKGAVGAVLAASLSGYSQTARAWFPRVRHDLSHYVLQPAEVRVRLFRPAEPGHGGHVAFMMLPKARGATNSFDLSVDDEGSVGLSWEQQRDWQDEQAERLAQAREEDCRWLVPRIHQHTVPLFGSLPASRLAMRWLYLDLLDLSLLKLPARAYDSFW